MTYRIDWDAIPDLLSATVPELEERLGCKRAQINQARTKRRRRLGIPKTKGWRRGHQVGIEHERARGIKKGAKCSVAGCDRPAIERWRGSVVCGEHLRGAGDAIDADLLSPRSMQAAAAEIVNRKGGVLR